MSKMGRPKKEIVKDKRVTIRLDQTEYDELVEYAQAHSLKIKEIIKRGIDLVYKNS